MEFTCVASVDGFIESIDPSSIKPGPIGVWSGSGEQVVIAGKRLCNSVFGPHYAVRWISGNGKGLFGKGLAFYSSWTKKEFPLLPVVK